MSAALNWSRGAYRSPGSFRKHFKTIVDHAPAPLTALSTCVADADSAPECRQVDLHRSQTAIADILACNLCLRALDPLTIRGDKALNGRRTRSARHNELDTDGRLHVQE